MDGLRVNARLAASALILLLGLAACASDSVAPPAEPAQPAEPQLPPEVRVGLLLPLSGPTEGLGYGPITRPDGLRAPPDRAAMARRRLQPLVERMQGDHGFEIAEGVTR